MLKIDTHADSVGGPHCYGLPQTLIFETDSETSLIANKRDSDAQSVSGMSFKVIVQIQTLAESIFHSNTDQ